LVAAARAGKLSPARGSRRHFHDLESWSRGQLLAARIVINQPQVAILARGRSRARSCAVELDGGPRPLHRSFNVLISPFTIDHRALDAFQANSFLAWSSPHWSDGLSRRRDDVPPNRRSNNDASGAGKGSIELHGDPGQVRFGCFEHARVDIPAQRCGLGPRPIGAQQSARAAKGLSVQAAVSHESTACAR